MSHQCHPDDCCGGRPDCPHSYDMNAREAAKHLNMHIQTVIRLAKEGRIHGKRIGADWKFRKDDLDKWAKTGWL